MVCERNRSSIHHHATIAAGRDAGVVRRAPAFSSCWQASFDAGFCNGLDWNLRQWIDVLVSGSKSPGFEAFLPRHCGGYADFCIRLGAMVPGGEKGRRLLAKGVRPDES